MNPTFHLYGMKITLAGDLQAARDRAHLARLLMFKTKLVNVNNLDIIQNNLRLNDGTHVHFMSQHGFDSATIYVPPKPMAPKPKRRRWVEQFIWPALEVENSSGDYAGIVLCKGGGFEPPYEFISTELYQTGRFPEDQPTEPVDEDMRILIGVPKEHHCIERQFEDIIPAGIQYVATDETVRESKSSFYTYDPTPLHFTWQGEQLQHNVYPYGSFTAHIDNTFHTTHAFVLETGVELNLNFPMYQQSSISGSGEDGFGATGTTFGEQTEADIEELMQAVRDTYPRPAPWDLPEDGFNRADITSQCRVDLAEEAEEQYCFWRDIVNPAAYDADSFAFSFMRSEFNSTLTFYRGCDNFYTDQNDEMQISSTLNSSATEVVVLDQAHHEVAEVENGSVHFDFVKYFMLENGNHYGLYYVYNTPDFVNEQRFYVFGKKNDDGTEFIVTTTINPEDPLPEVFAAPDDIDLYCTENQNYFRLIRETVTYEEDL